MTEVTELDLRVYLRKVFRCPAQLSVEDNPPVNAWTVDISIDGMSLMLAKPIAPNQYCVIKFETVIKETPRTFSSIARSAYSVRSSTGEYRTGFQFFQISAASASIIDELREV